MYMLIFYLKSITAIAIIFILINLIYDLYLNNKKNINIETINTKMKEFSFIRKVENYILEITNSKNFIYKNLTLLLFLIISLSFSLIMFIIAYSLFKLFSSSIVIAIFSFFIPYFILKSVINSQKQKIINIFPTYAITLKNYTQVTNDIIIAFKKANTQKPLSIFIDRFNISIEKGVKVYDAFEKLKKDINIKKINEFLNASQVCYLNGGDFSKLLERYSKILTKTNMQREKEKEENLSSVIVLIVLILINIYMIVAFIFSNAEYKNIMLNTFTGKMIFNINILSYILIFFFMQKINKMEE